MGGLVTGGFTSTIWIDCSLTLREFEFPPAFSPRPCSDLVWICGLSSGFGPVESEDDPGAGFAGDVVMELTGGVD